MQLFRNLGGLQKLFLLLGTLGIGFGIAGGLFQAGGLGLFLFGGVVFFLALFWHRFKRDGKTPRWWRNTRTITAWALSLAAATGAILASVMAYHAYFTPPDTKTGTVVVLGCQVVGDQPSIMLQRRLDAAYEYLAAHPETDVVVSGGQGDRELYSEASVMANYLIGRGISADRVYLEDQSRNTQQNLEFTSRVIAECGLSSEIAVATDAFHEYRAAVYAKRSGLNATSIPAATPFWLLPSYWVREFFAVLRALILP